MTQITEYERPFNIVFGNDGDEPTVVSGPEGPDFPIWRARQFVLALLKSQEGKTEDTDERSAFINLRQQFRAAETGDLLFGMVRKFTNRKGIKRFIGIVPKGIDYRDAGKPARKPEPKNLPPLLPDTAERRFGTVAQQQRPTRPQKPQPTEAERIAAKMAKASRDAVEGER
jgi:hypothetical protein